MLTVEAGQGLAAVVDSLPVSAAGASASPRGRAGSDAAAVSAACKKLIACLHGLNRLVGAEYLGVGVVGLPAVLGVLRTLTTLSSAVLAPLLCRPHSVPGALGIRV
jgi:hypothetical protein